MVEVVLRAKAKMGHFAGASAIGSIRKDVNQAASHITQLLNPSPVARTLSDTAEAVGNLVTQKSLVEDTVSRAVEWNVKHLKLGLCAAKKMMEKAGDMDRMFSSVKDKCLATAMEIKAGNFIPEPIQRIFF